MDPRPKVRSYKVLNTDPALDVPAVALPATRVGFGAVCFKDRTT